MFGALSGTPVTLVGWRLSNLTSQAHHSLGKCRWNKDMIGGKLILPRGSVYSRNKSGDSVPRTRWS
jgi:hypothetical protein